MAPNFLPASVLWSRRCVPEGEGADPPLITPAMAALSGIYRKVSFKSR